MTRPLRALTTRELVELWKERRDALRKIRRTEDDYSAAVLSWLEVQEEIWRRTGGPPGKK